MGNTKKNKWVPLVLTVLMVLSIFGAFIFGTVVGFNVSVRQLSGCEEVSCTELGVEADMCEVCEERGIHIVRLEG